MKILVFDIETDGLLDTMTCVHSLVIKSWPDGEVWSCCDNDHPMATSIDEGLRLLMEADMVVGHNIIKFDLPALKLVYPWFDIDERKVFDTLVASRLIWTNVVDTDLKKIRQNRTTLPMKLAGKHSLEAWGHRLGNWKGDYSAMMEERGLDPWAAWSQEMQDYCEQDVEVTYQFYELILRKNYSADALQLEHSLAFLMAQMERTGYGFDVPRAEKLYAHLAGKREELAGSLRSLFTPWYVRDGSVASSHRVPKKAHKTLGYWGHRDDDLNWIGYPFTKVKLQVFNPNSRDQIADRLMKVRGWKPKEFTPGGAPKVDDEILEELKYPEAEALAEYMTLQKRITQLAEGDMAWLKLVTPQGLIHGSINPNGAVTGRATHSYPNIAQVPKVGTLFGAECRELFRPITAGWYQLGCDVSGLELRMLGHFMAKYDDGAYGREVINGDIHTLNQEAAGLPTRDNAKTFIYAFLYGAGDEKIGSIIGKGWAAGRAIKQKFFKQVPALRKLIEGVIAAAESKGFIRGLDGRLLHIRSSHAALNTLLQSAGALVCKQWIVEFNKLLIERGLHNMVHIMAWVHDELQMEVHPSLVKDGVDAKGKPIKVSVIGDICIEAIVRAGDHFGIKVPLTGEYKIGQNWKDCH